MATQPTIQRGNHIFEGAVSFTGPVFFPDGMIDNRHISDNANHRIDQIKVIHRPDLNYSQANGVNVTSAEVVLRVARGAGTMLSVTVRPDAAPAGGNRKYTVDVLKAANASGSWTSLLDSPIEVDNTSVDDTLQLGDLIADPSYASGDAIKIVVTASGSTGTQGQGFCATINLAEAPE